MARAERNGQESHVKTRAKFPAFHHRTKKNKTYVHCLESKMSLVHKLLMQVATDENIRDAAYQGGKKVVDIHSARKKKSKQKVKDREKNREKDRRPDRDRDRKRDKEKKKTTKKDTDHRKSKKEKETGAHQILEDVKDTILENAEDLVPAVLGRKQSQDKDSTKEEEETGIEKIGNVLKKPLEKVGAIATGAFTKTEGLTEAAIMSAGLRKRPTMAEELRREVGSEVGSEASLDGRAGSDHGMIYRDEQEEDSDMPNPWAKGHRIHPRRETSFDQMVREAEQEDAFLRSVDPQERYYHTKQKALRDWARFRTEELGTYKAHLFGSPILRRAAALDEAAERRHQLVETYREYHAARRQARIDEMQEAEEVLIPEPETAEASGEAGGIDQWYQLRNWRRDMGGSQARVKGTRRWLINQGRLFYIPDFADDEALKEEIVEVQRVPYEVLKRTIL